MTISAHSLAHIRFGFGFRPDARPIDGAQGLLEQLETASAPRLAQDVAARRGLLETYRRASRLERKGELPKAKVKAINADIAKLILQDFRQELTVQVTSPAGFKERLVAFWADHFTVSARGRLLSMLRAAFVADVIRPNVGGNLAICWWPRRSIRGCWFIWIKTAPSGPILWLGWIAGGG